MNNDEVLQTAMLQSAIDANCCVQDFCKTENVIVYSKKNSNARRYLELPFACNLISYGSNIVASIDEKYEKIVRAYIEKYPIASIADWSIAVCNTSSLFMCTSYFHSLFFI